ncbi:P-loop ATPase, Sll1717 family [Agrobacterium cavarae]|uniref:P-loop ATPase, Sll1717 family n=1 Tax=Agrobacterium cavarae TaxID=2528239 RepID=UPI002FDA8166
MANPVVFRRNTGIGSPDAESDAAYLSECFLDNGDVDSLMDTDDPKCIVLGRTGAGKSALLAEVLKRGEHAVELSPEALALNYVNNSEVLRFFEAAGVNLDVFYSLLWRHILTVELLKMRYEIKNAENQRFFLDRLGELFSRDRVKERALKYLREWGDHFWEETEYRTKEFTRKLETDLKASAKAAVSFVSLGAEGAKKLSEEQVIEVRECGNRVVNAVQVKELHDVINLLSENIFDNKQKKYYIVIDRLDETWVSDHVRFKLIKALFETVKTFKRVQNIKIIIALRTDIHYRMIRETPTAGFQEEKYRAMYLPLRWNRNQLVEMLEKRVRTMFRRQYTRENVSLKDILPANQIEQRSAAEYMLDRTFFRPREAIIFLNECIVRAEGTTRITAALIRQAEVQYSQQRLQSLGDEWRRDYPNLLLATSLLSRVENPFTIESLGIEKAEKAAVAILEANAARDEILEFAESYYFEDKTTWQEFVENILLISYMVGLVGVKPEPHLGRQWSYLDQPTMTRDQLKSTSLIDVHKTFWASLGVIRRGKGAYGHDADQ